MTQSRLAGFSRFMGGFVGGLVLVLGLSQSAFSAHAAEGKKKMSVFQIPLQTLSGKPASLETYRGKILLIVNTASECGYTPQYKGLQELHERYSGKGLVVLGFPSNDFGAQEPGSAQQIQTFCERNYGVKFPLFAKGPVSGAQKQPLFAWLVEHSSGKSEIGWNFEKFLVGPDGDVLQRFKSGDKPMGGAIEDAVRRLLER